MATRRAARETSRNSRSTAAKSAPVRNERLHRVFRESGFLLLLPLAVYLLLCLISYSPQDPGWSHSGQPDKIANFGGQLGAWFADLLYYFSGYCAWLFPLLLLAFGARVLRGSALATPEGSQLDPSFRLVGGFLLFVAGTGLCHLNFGGPTILPGGTGGILGALIGGGSAHAAGLIGANMLLFALFLIAITLATGLSWFRLMDSIGGFILRSFGR
ncbi:MAG: DNA translocase FtsK 4TM domain-containing protein, partial [Dokdonella sp.]